MKKTLATVVAFFLFYAAIGQKRIGVVETMVLQQKSSKLVLGTPLASDPVSAIPAYCIDYFANNQDYIAIDRKNTSLINQEMELQKSENFMDGYVVDQGKSEGLDFILFPLYNSDTYEVTLRVYSIADKKILCGGERKLDKNMFGIKDLKQQVNSILIELNEKCFDATIPFVRILEPKGKKPKTALIAVGRDGRVRPGFQIELYVIVDENIQGKVIKRKETIGIGEIIKVEDENFSTLEFKKGAEKVLESSNSGQPIYCKILAK